MPRAIDDLDRAPLFCSQDVQEVVALVAVEHQHVADARERSLHE